MEWKWALALDWYADWYWKISLTAAEDPLYEIPFMVGVAGHRDPLPAQIPAIRVAVGALFRQLVDAHPAVRIQLICPMADGADLLVAEVALDMGIDILALLTFPEDICRADLHSDAAQSIFDRVLAKAERLELPLAPGVTREHLKHGAPERDRQFQRAALVLATYSSLLIVIWDGKATEHAAGTARVVEFRQRGIRLSHEQDLEQPDLLLGARDNDLIYDIRCARSSDPAACATSPPLDVRGFVGADFDLSATHPAHQLPADLHRLLARTAEFNHDTRAAGQDIATRGYPITPPGSPPVPATLQLVEQLFVQADYLGGHFRRCFLRAIKFRYTMWALMAALLFSFDKLSTGMTGLVIIMMVLAIFVTGRQHASRAHRNSWHRKYLDYRALAEALRVDYFWEITGVRRRFAGEFAHESFLQKQDSDLEWIRAAMRAVSLRLAMRPSAPAPDAFARAHAGWIGDESAAGGGGQLSYYRNRSHQLNHRLHQAEKVDKALLALGLALAITFLIDISLSMLDVEFLPHAPRHMLLWTMTLLTVYAGIYDVYLAERNDRTLIRQFRYMHSLFRFADNELQSARTEGEKLEILRSLGHACLAEHAQWTLAQRDKTIQGLKW